MEDPGVAQLISGQFIPLKLTTLPLLEKYGATYGLDKAATFLVLAPDGAEITRSHGMVDWETGAVDFDLWYAVLQDVARKNEE